MNMASRLAECIPVLLCLLLTSCSDDIPDVPEPLSEAAFWDIKGPEVEILIPVDGSSIGWFTTVGGTYKRVPEDQNILVYGSSHAIDPDLWYLQAVASRNTNGTWEARSFIGQKEVVSGAKFDICVVLAGEAKTREIIAEMEKMENVEPMTLPGEILSRITVTRK